MVLTAISLGTRVALAYILPATVIGVTGIWWSVPAKNRRASQAPDGHPMLPFPQAKGWMFLIFFLNHSPR